MRIASIYIYPNSKPHLFGEDHLGITINLGARFFYKVFTIRDKEIIEKIGENKNFIEGFWGENVNLVSAIVGANGTGKTTILNLIKEGCLLVIEDDNKGAYTEWTSEIGRFFYYSPFLTENNAETDVHNVHNVSKLSQMRNDTKGETATFEALWEYHKSERLQRIISFITQERYRFLVRDLKITPFSKIKVSFFKLPRKDWNASRNFLPFFDAFIKLKEKEREEKEQAFIDELKLDSVDKIKKSEDYNTFSKNLKLKLEILESILLKILNILERSGNKYLEEGFIKDDLWANNPEFKAISSTKDAFYWFLDKAFIEERKQKYYLPTKNIKELLELLTLFADQDKKIENWTQLTINFEQSVTFIDTYQRFLLSFKNVFTYDETIFMTFEPEVSLSTGEMSFYELFSSLDHINYRLQKQLDFPDHQIENVAYPEYYIFLIDEGDLGFHPTWKKAYVNSIVSGIPKIFEGKKVQIIFTTHSPLSLSDIPNTNIAFLDKDPVTRHTILVNNSIVEMQSFGANITDLLSNSFFLKEHLIGDFAKSKINEVITWINKNKKLREEISEEEYKRNKQIISIIEEPILRNKLVEMLSEIRVDDEFVNEMIAKETDYLRKLLSR